MGEERDLLRALRIAETVDDRRHHLGARSTSSKPCDRSPVRAKAHDRNLLANSHWQATALRLDLKGTYNSNMEIDLERTNEEQLRRLAAEQGREIGSLIREAVREYLEAAAITDVTPEEVAATQLAVAGQLVGLPTSNDGNG